jgi:hypothetical protein
MVSQGEPARTPVDGRTQPEDTFLRLRRFLGENVRVYRVFVGALNGNRTLVNWAVTLGLKGELGGFEELDSNLMPALREYPPALQNAWAQTKAQLRELNAESSKEGIRFIIAMVPALQSVAATTQKVTRVFEVLAAGLRFEQAVYRAGEFRADRRNRGDQPTGTLSRSLQIRPAPLSEARHTLQRGRTQLVCQ